MSPIPVWVSRQTVLKPRTQHHEVVKTFDSSSHTVKPRILVKSNQMIFAAYAFIDILPSRPFQFLLSNFSAKSLHPPKRIVKAYIMDPPTATKTPRSSPHQRPSMRTPERVNSFAYSDDNSAKSNNTTAYVKKKTRPTMQLYPYVISPRPTKSRKLDNMFARVTV